MTHDNFGGRQREAVDHAVSQIDKVHSGALVGAVTIKDEGRIHEHNEAEFFASERWIRVRGNAPTPELSAVHEFGHLLHTDGFNSAEPGRLSELYPYHAVMEKSESVNRLKSIAKHNSGHEEGTRKYAEYLAGPREQFARDYEHYIATKSKDPKLLDQLAVQRARSWGGLAYRSDEDFKPIKKAFDQILKSKGVLHGK